MRKNFFNDAKDGYFKREKRETAAKNPMTGIKSMITSKFILQYTMSRIFF
jgi:hypothetical protein